MAASEMPYSLPGADGLICFPRSDGDPERHPGGLRGPTEDISLYTPLSHEASSNMYWRTCVGRAVAEELMALKPGGQYRVAEWPQHYRLYSKARKSGGDHTDVYLFGTKSTSRFRSPKEFVPHAISLLSQPSLDPQLCPCKYCGGKRVKYSMGLPHHLVQHNSNCKVSASQSHEVFIPARGLLSLPAEMMSEIASYMEYDSSSIRALTLVSRRMNILFTGELYKTVRLNNAGWCQKFKNFAAQVRPVMARSVIHLNIMLVLDLDDIPRITSDLQMLGELLLNMSGGGSKLNSLDIRFEVSTDRFRMVQDIGEHYAGMLERPMPRLESMEFFHFPALQSCSFDASPPVFPDPDLTALSMPFISKTGFAQFLDKHSDLISLRMTFGSLEPIVESARLPRLQTFAGHGSGAFARRICDGQRPIETMAVTLTSPAALQWPSTDAFRRVRRLSLAVRKGCAPSVLPVSLAAVKGLVVSCPNLEKFGITTNASCADLLDAVQPLDALRCLSIDSPGFRARILGMKGVPEVIQNAFRNHPFLRCVILQSQVEGGTFHRGHDGQVTRQAENCNHWEFLQVAMTLLSFD